MVVVVIGFLLLGSMGAYLVYTMYIIISKCPFCAGMIFY